ncbi:MAG TPA: efflux RND transporter permease subunit [Desulfatiglandales bacterium]|nr:efflux RND transporter permease subunit [Desulfatiglandales bacterium]
MSLSSLSIKRAITFTMIYVFVVGFGLFGLSRLKIDLYPDITFPVIAIITTYSGVAPADMETLVTKPIEEAVASVENIKHIRSQSKLGASLILAEFDWGIDLDKSEKDIRNNVDFIRDYLPDEASEPLIIAFDPQKMPILFMSVSGPMGPAELRELSRKQIKPALERIVGVASAETAGGLKRQIQVQIEPAKLQAQGLSVDTVISALSRENKQVPGGKLDEGGSEFSIRTLSEYTSVEQIANTVIGYREETPLYVKNVAQVQDTYEELTRVIRNNRKPGLLLLVSKNSKANTVQVANRVIESFPKIVSRLPQGVKIGVIFNQADFIKRSISNLSSTAVQAFFLAALVLLFFLQNIRASIIVALSIPISIVVTFAVLDLAEITLNMMSMAGLALAVGLLVDNSIVVLENIFRHFKGSGNLFKSADSGTREVGTAIIASTLTTISVFFPILFVPGIAGVMFNDMALTICFSLFCALLVSLTLIPLLSSRFLKENSEENRTLPQRISRRIDGSLEKLLSLHARTLSWCLDHRKTTLMISFLMFAMSLATVPRLGMDFFPKMDQSNFEMAVERAPGTSLKSTEMTFRQIEDIIHETIPELKNQNSDIGVGEAFGAFAKGSYAGQIRVNLIDKEKRDRTQREVESALRKRLDQIPGITYSITQGHFFGEEGDLIIYLYGEDLDIGKKLSDKIKETIKDVPGALDVNTSLEAGRPELQIDLDRDRVSALGLSTQQVANAVSTYIKGTRASLFRDRGEEYDILVQLDPRYRKSTEILKNLYVTNPQGEQIPLSSIARIRRSTSPTSILRRDQQRVINIAVTVQGRSLGEVTRDVEKRLEKIDFSSDFTYETGGSAQDMRTSFKWLLVAFGGAAFIVYMVMASLYESFVAPFIIFLTIPLAIVGAIAMLLLTGTPLSVVAFIGIIMLAGIVVNNSIVLVDYINQLRGRGYAIRDAVMEGGKTRLRPILMTALTTILALTPLALGLGSGGEAWSPMARSVIGGLTASTLLTLLVIPVIYTYLTPKKVTQISQSDRDS